MLLHDTHAHLDLLFEKMGYLPARQSVDINDTITLSDEAKIALDQLLIGHEFVIHATVDTANAASVSRIFGFHDKVKILLGAHPEIVSKSFNVDNFIADQQTFIKQNSNYLYSKIVGIGECGLDYFYSQDSGIIALQKQLFRSQIQLACSLQLPLIIHCRDAFDDMFEILDEYPAIFNHFLVHCFTGGIDEMNKIIHRGGYIGLGGICTFDKKSGNLQEAVQQATSTAIMLETDLPFLAPTPYRGQICLPEYISSTAEKIGSLRGQHTSEILQFSRQNVQKLFNM